MGVITAERDAAVARRIERAVARACILEASAEKPGNVTPTRSFRDTTYADFVASARAIAPVLAQAGRRSPGELILESVRATRRVVRVNTNLGIILLLVPLARAYALEAAAAPPAEAVHAARLRRGVARVLTALTVDDARLAYEAIRLASPGGLGTAPGHDVRDEPRGTLLEAMAAAAGRDSIAAEYASAFARTFGQIMPALEQALATGLGVRDAIVQTFLLGLAAVPDTLVARKLGMAAAEEVSARARAVLAAGGVRTRSGRSGVRDLDGFLRDPANHRNPGTTADLVAAGLFVHLVLGGRLRGPGAGVPDRTAGEASRVCRFPGA